MSEKLSAITKTDSSECTALSTELFVIDVNSLSSDNSNIKVISCFCFYTYIILQCHSLMVLHPTYLCQLPPSKVTCVCTILFVHEVLL